MVCLYLIARWHALYADLAWAVAAGAAMVLVTAVLSWLAWTGRAHRAPVVASDVVITAVLTLASIPAQSGDQRHGSMTTLTTIWAVGPALEAGILLGAYAGLIAAAAQFAVSLVVRSGYDLRTLYSGVLLLMAGGFTGYAATLAVRTERALQAATAARAASDERTRMARSIHDGTLQLLSLVHRNGLAAGGEWARLALAAGEQERALRGLIAQPDAAAPSRASDAETDLCLSLRALRSDRVTVVTPAGHLALGAATTDELTAAVRAALDNVSVHAGRDAHAWVLLEHEGDEVRITVRDDGAGFAVGRLDEAAGEHRLGVTHSIRGRIVRLGGEVDITSEPGRGTTVQLAVPVA